MYWDYQQSGKEENVNSQGERKARSVDYSRSHYSYLRYRTWHGLLVSVLISRPLIDATIANRQPQGLVFQAVEANSGRTTALKKSRVSQRVKRTILRYESRILQLPQGRPAIPAIYRYGQLPHFEYLAMELLGPSLKGCTTGPVAVATVVRVVMVCVALRLTQPVLVYIVEICRSFPP